MSRKDAARFLMQLRGDALMQRRLDCDPSPSAFIEEGRRAGYEFTAEELRGAEAAERFYQKASSDPVLFKRVRSADDDTAVVAIAEELGFHCGVEDLVAVLLPLFGEVGEADLERVAGGVTLGTSHGGRSSSIDICKVPAPPAPFAPIPYPNVGSPSGDTAHLSPQLDTRK